MKKDVENNYTWGMPQLDHNEWGDYQSKHEVEVQEVVSTRVWPWRVHLKNDWKTDVGNQSAISRKLAPNWEGPSKLWPTLGEGRTCLKC